MCGGREGHFQKLSIGEILEKYLYREFSETTFTTSTLFQITLMMMLVLLTSQLRRRQLGSIPPVPNFAKIHTRGPRGRLRIAPRDLIPPPPAHVSAAQAMRLWLPSALSSTVHTHSNEALRQTSSNEAHHRSANEKQQHINRTGL